MLRPASSIRRTLLLWVLWPQVILWLAGCGLSWWLAQHETHAALEQALMAQASALASCAPPHATAQTTLDVLEQPARALMLLNPAEQPAIWLSIVPQGMHAGSGPIPLPDEVAAPSPNGAARFYQLPRRTHEAPRRAVLIEQALSAQPDSLLRIQVARTHIMDAAAQWSLLTRLVLPMSVLILLLSCAMGVAIHRGLLPLGQLVEAIDGIQSGDLHPVIIARAPGEVQAIAHAINHLLSSVQNNVDSEKRFIADAAHQLRTPLAGLVSQADLAMSETDPARVRERIVHMRGAAQRSAHLVQQMLTLARFEGVPLQKPESYDLAALARDIAREWTPRALAASIDLGYEGDVQAQVLGDRTLMREAIHNLIDNALRYAGCGAEVTVRVQARQSADADGVRQVMLEVADDGPGVDAQNLPRLFQRFWRADESAPGGCGIGLALVAKVASLHHGAVSAQQATPHGLAVRMLLPHAGAHATPPRADWDYEPAC